LIVFYTSNYMCFIKLKVLYPILDISVVMGSLQQEYTPLRHFDYFIWENCSHMWIWFVWKFSQEWINHADQELPVQT